MAPVIWGLELKQMQWSKFGSKYMFKNKDYHLRRTKFIVYQLALIFCVVSESLGTAALSDYNDEQNFVQGQAPDAYVFNNDYVGVASYNIFAGVFVAFVFGAAFFFDLFWPERHESTGVRWAWKVCGVLAVCFHLASALAITVITARHSGYVTGIPADEASNLLSQFHKDGGTPLDYKHNGRAVAAVVFAWLGTASVIPSCILLFLSIDNSEKGRGPKSAHAEGREEASRYAKTGETSRNNDPEAAMMDIEKQQDPAQANGESGDARHAATAAEGLHPGYTGTQER